MRATEFIVKQGLDEGWREQLANIGVAGAIAAGGTGGLMVKQALDHQSTKPAQVVTQPAGKFSLPNITVASIKNIKPITNSPLETILLNAAKAAGIAGLELAAFMAQCAHETNNFSSLEEYGGSLDFRKYDPAFNPTKAKALGNIKRGDGARFKGRGFIQITGRYNYRKAGQALGVNLEHNPNLAENPRVAAAIAIWYWKNRVQPAVNNFKDIHQVTKPINPALRGIEDRFETFKSYILGSTDTQGSTA